MTGPFTPAELEAGCKAVHELEDETVDRYLSVQREVAAALRAVAPLIAARVRAEVADSIADTIEAMEDDDRQSVMGARHACVAIAHAHRTTSGGGS